MKIVIVTLEYAPQVGGIASYVYNVAKHVPPNQVAVVAPAQKGDKDYDKNMPWPTFRVKPFFSFLWPRWLRLYFALRKLLKKEKDAHLHIHHVLPLGTIALLLKRQKRIARYTVFLHGSDYQLANQHPRKRREFIRVCHGADRIVVNSLFSKHEVEKILDVTPPEITVVYPCPSDEFFENPDTARVEKLRTELALRGHKVLLTVARLVDRKGHLILMRLLPKILAAVPNVVWLIVGDGPKKVDIVSALQRHSLQNIVRFLGEVPQTDVPVYYHLADAFILLTHKDEDNVDEAWGTVFLEAAACGVPVIAGHSGGVEEAVRHLETGIVLDPYAEQAVVATVAELLKRGDYAAQLGRAGRARATAEFTWEKQLQKLFVS